jgi:hypothetical protein
VSNLYTRFAYSHLRVALPVVSVDVDNAGIRAGDEVDFRENGSVSYEST